MKYGRKSLEVEEIRNRRRFRLLLVVFMTILLLLSAGACSSQVAPTAQPSQASMDPEEVQALVEAAVEAAVSKSAARSGEEISQQQLREMMEEVVAEASPVSSQPDLADLVEKSIKKELDTRPPQFPRPMWNVSSKQKCRDCRSPLMSLLSRQQREVGCRNSPSNSLQSASLS